MTKRGVDGSIMSPISTAKCYAVSTTTSNTPSEARLISTVSQFTLLASTKKGSKPDFHKSAGPDKGRELYTAFFKKVQDLYDHEKVKDGVFQAMMDVSLINDGPVGGSHIHLLGSSLIVRRLPLRLTLIRLR